MSESQLREISPATSDSIENSAICTPTISSSMLEIKVSEHDGCELLPNAKIESNTSHCKEISIGNIAEREITLHRFEFQLKMKRTIIILCYFIISLVELIYFRYFSFWCFCPLLLCLCWLLLLIFQQSLYHYFYHQILTRFLCNASIATLNLLTVISLIYVYSVHFGSMHHFQHDDDYCFELLLVFNILFIFSCFALDIDIIHYPQYTVYPFKLIFLGCTHLEQYKIRQTDGKWTTQRYTFQHPVAAHFQSPIAKNTQRKLSAYTPQPIGIWQRVILICLVVGILGSVISTISGIQRMQPYIAN